MITIFFDVVMTKPKLFLRINLQGHPPELSDSVKLLLSDAKRYGFEIDQVLKSID